MTSANVQTVFMMMEIIIGFVMLVNPLVWLASMILPVLLVILLLWGCWIQLPTMLVMLVHFAYVYTNITLLLILRVLVCLAIIAVVLAMELMRTIVFTVQLMHIEFTKHLLTHVRALMVTLIMDQLKPVWFVIHGVQNVQLLHLRPVQLVPLTISWN